MLFTYPSSHNWWQVLLYVPVTLSHRTPSFVRIPWDVRKGIFLIASGLFKKAIISDYISVNFVERIFDNPTLYSGRESDGCLWICLANLLRLFRIQWYGYRNSLVVRFHFNKNFDSPYKSASITEFWRRWHISLSSWLKDYLYISFGWKPERKDSPVCQSCHYHVFGWFVAWRFLEFCRLGIVPWHCFGGT